MISRKFCFFSLFFLFFGFIGAVSASYSGDEPLTQVFFDKMNGGYIFSTGNSTYSGQMDNGDEYYASFYTEIPPDAKPVFSRLYVYWAWSKLGKSAIYPTISVAEFLANTYDFELKDRYVDSKGFVSSYDFFSGTDSYDISGIKSGENSFSVKLKNSATDNSSFVIEGISLLVVYESPSSPYASVWVNEGCDMIYSDYGITPDMATATAVFNGTIDTGNVKKARLELIAPSGGYTRTDIPDKNVVFFNREEKSGLPDFLESIISAIFPGYNGKEWIDCFDSDEVMQIGVDVRDAGSYLRDSNNIVMVQDRGDYMLFSNAILYVEEKEAF